MIDTFRETDFPTVEKQDYASGSVNLNFISKVSPFSDFHSTSPPIWADRLLIMEVPSVFEFDNFETSSIPGPLSEITSLISSPLNVVVIRSTPSLFPKRAYFCALVTTSVIIRPQDMQGLKGMITETRSNSSHTGEALKIVDTRFLMYALKLTEDRSSERYSSA